MSVYAGKHPHTEALMWAWQQVSGSDQERRAKAESLAEWVLMWRPSPLHALPQYHPPTAPKAEPNLKNSTMHPSSKPVIDPLAPIQTWGPMVTTVTSYSPKPYDSLTPSSLQDFLGALSSAASIATPDVSDHQAGAAAGDVVPAASPAMSPLPSHRPRHDDSAPSGYR